MGSAHLHGGPVQFLLLSMFPNSGNSQLFCFYLSLCTEQASSTSILFKAYRLHSLRFLLNHARSYGQVAFHYPELHQHNEDTGTKEPLTARWTICNICVKGLLPVQEQVRRSSAHCSLEQLQREWITSPWSSSLV